MDAYRHQRRFAGSRDAPPPQPPPPSSHPNPHWYPGPAPPPYAPHPNHPSFPPQHHHQWDGPTPDLQHHLPPPPYAYQPPPPPMQMQPPPPAPGNPWPPHHAAVQPPPPQPPPPGQTWTNQSWAQNHGYTGLTNEDDWATKAKEWAAAKSVAQNHQIQQHVVPASRTEGHHYGYHDLYQQPAGLPTEPLHPPIPQSSSEQFPFQMTGQQRETNYLPDRGPMVPPAKSFGSFPSTYEQEVSYNYSSAPGNGNAMLQYPSSQAQPSPTASSVQDGFPRGPPSMPGHDGQSFRMMVDPSDQPLEFNGRKAPDMAVHQTVNISSTVPTAVSGHETIATSTQSWGPSATVGFFPRTPVPPQAAQMDPSVHAAPLFGAVSGANYVPPAAFGVGSVTEAFPTDANTLFNVAERSKKPPVPNWLREELLKKKSTPVSASVQHSKNSDSMESEDAGEPLKRADQTDSRSIDSAKSTEDDEDDEDGIEEARTAAINQEIKRVLTEVLLKVTDDLFDEIATKVLNEDDSSANEPTSVSSSKEPDPGESKAKTMAKVVVPAKPTNMSSTDCSDGTGLSSPKGALLGLASYDSDDEDDDGDGEGKILISNLSSEIKVGAAHPEEGEKSVDGERHRNHNESNASIAVSSVDNHKFNGERSRRRANAESERELRIHDTQNGEFPLDAKTSIQSKGAIHTMNEKAHRHAEIDFQNGKTPSGSHTENNNNVESTHRHLERSSHEEDLVKEAKVVHRKDLESSTADKYSDADMYSVHRNIDKMSSFKEEKGSGRYVKHGSYKRDDAKGDQMDLPKDARERNRDTTDRRGEKGKDDKDDRSRQITKSSASHSSRRSRSPRGRSQTRKESSSHVRGSVSSDEPSDNVKKRKPHSHKNSKSPSPPKSRNRRVSRSPHSKHSHRRHSPYSSADRKKRSRSRTPVKRR